MRRLFVLVAGVGLLHAAAGCQHIAGFCDCAPPIQPCCLYGLYPPGHGAPVAAPPAAAPSMAAPSMAEPPQAVPPGTPPAVTPPTTPPPAREPVMRERIGLSRDL
jgi:hypothetical protein